MARDKVTVIKDVGKPLLEQSTAQKMKVLHVGLLYKAYVRSVATEESDSDICTEYAEILGKLKNY